MVPVILHLAEALVAFQGAEMWTPGEGREALESTPRVPSQ